MAYDWDFSHVRFHTGAYLSGIGTTLLLTVLCCTIGTMGGMLVATVLRGPAVIRIPASGIVYALRGVPELVLLFFFYFFPVRQIFGVAPPTPFWCATMAFSLSLAVFVGGLFASAVDQVPAIQLLGAQAVGMSPAELVRYIYIPQIARITLPGLLAFWISILKLTSLASVIGVPDVVYVARIGMSENARALEAWLTVALVYVTLVTPASLFVKKIEQLPWMRHQ